MKSQDVEKLMAYADGELNSNEHAEVQALLASDPQAREVLQAFTQNKPLLQAAYQPVLQEPVPQRLLDAVRRSAGAVPLQTPVPRPLQDAPQMLPGAPAARDGAAHPQAIAANRPIYWPQFATAAGVALVVGLLGGHWWGSQGGSSQDVAARQFQQVMQTAATGESVSLVEKWKAVSASFQNKSGQLCREFEQDTGQRLAHGLACKTADQWVVVIAVDRGPTAIHDPKATQFKLAAGEADLLAAAIKGLDLEAALLPAEEQAWIQKGWKTSP